MIVLHALTEEHIMEAIVFVIMEHCLMDSAFILVMIQIATDATPIQRFVMNVTLLSLFLEKDVFVEKGNILIIPQKDVLTAIQPASTVIIPLKTTVFIAV